MKCHLCSNDIPDESTELCPYCGSPVFQSAEDSDALSNNSGGADLRLKELIEDVKRSLEELPGEAESTLGHPPANVFSPDFEQLVSESAASNAQNEEMSQEDLRAFDLTAPHAQSSDQEKAESVSQENLSSVIIALDQVLPQQPREQDYPRRKPGLFAIAAACSAGAALIFLTIINFRHILLTPFVSGEKPFQSSQALSEKPSAEQSTEVLEPAPTTTARQLVSADNLTDRAEQMFNGQQNTAALPEVDNTTTTLVQERLPPPPAPQQQKLQQFFTIHTDSYRSEHKATREAKRLTNLGRDAFVEVFDSSQSGRWYRVMIGRFATREDATAALEEVRQTLQKNDCRVVSLRR